VGKTEDGRVVVRGLFEFYDTYGVPLDMAVNQVNRAGFVPDWVCLYERCLRAGWKPSSTWEKLSSLVGDVFGPEYRVQWELRMKAHLEKQNG
jgi:hypothetical protein